MELCVERKTALPWSGNEAKDTCPPGAPGWVSPSAGGLEVPGDLGSWVRPSLLLAWAVDEVARLNWNEREKAACLQELPEYRSQVMLCVLAFAYARQIFDSEGIARACRTEPILQRLCRGSVPFAAELQSFRRRNRPVLERILTGVFMRAIRQRFDLAGVPLPAELEEDLQQLAAERLNIARHMDAVEW